MNSMCDITQFLISSPICDNISVHSPQLLISDDVLTFGICSIVVADDGISFKGLFMVICKALDLTYW